MHLKRVSVLTSCDAGSPVLDPSVATIAKLSRALAAHDLTTHEHSRRVQRYAVSLAIEAGVSDVEQLHAINVAALLHDIGKIRMPLGVLHKSGPLTLDEYEQVKHHALLGARMISAAALPESIALLVRHHHENWDGTGYPDRLRGKAIPIGARVLAVADCYDALTSDRPYRRAMSHEYAVTMIQERRGSMYDRDVVDAFERIVEALDSPGLQARAM